MFNAVTEMLIKREQAQQMAYTVICPMTVFSDGLVVPAWQRKPRHPGAVELSEDDRDTILKNHRFRYQINWYVPAKWFIDNC